eukprot:CAMPEP_0182934232 /NCGR_PEP_ID=MMETSP0105_2-20130417/35727_1 /TAXON_ID=81532 ORGANISM="Acanthoeca-like sp., Strain 10tr" /NCGR_SAMPLE_ID=MMETSP0105_2 /ASSEMBLY_ACC=CAM_ASM_000205 /LENGTH=188 /DNA_ID=CAMNT_0025073059 /DNA_START=64 /DNA_END=630 /DNA_ORIENTATION=+
MADSDDDWETMEDSGAFEAEAQAEIDKQRQQREADEARLRAAQQLADQREQTRRRAEFEAALAAKPSPQKLAAAAPPRVADIGMAKPKGPVIKIMKRDPAANAAAKAAADGGKAGTAGQPAKKKSLKEREAEYAAARARIMAEEDPLRAEPPKPTRADGTAIKPADPKPILREPHGPDGSSGFRSRSS